MIPIFLRFSIRGTAICSVEARRIMNSNSKGSPVSLFRGTPSAKLHPAVSEVLQALSNRQFGGPVVIDSLEENVLSHLEFENRPCPASRGHIPQGLAEIPLPPHLGRKHDEAGQFGGHFSSGPGEIETGSKRIHRFGPYDIGVVLGDLGKALLDQFVEAENYVFGGNGLTVLETGPGIDVEDDGVSVVDAPFFEGFSGAAREGADEGFAGAGGRFFMIGCRRLRGGRGPGGVGTSSGVEDGGGEGEQQERKGPGRVDLSEEFSR